MQRRPLWAAVRRESMARSMTPLQPRSNTPFSPFQVVMLVLVLGVVAGGSLLLAAPETTQLMEGAIEWQEESILRAVVRLLCLNYDFPTHHPDTVKSYLLGLGAGFALLAYAVHVWGGRRDELGSPPAVDRGEMGLDLGAWRSTPEPVADRSRSGSQITPRTAVQLLLGLFLLWSFASSRWSSAPDLSWGASLQTAIPWLWAFVLGATLERRGIRLICRLCIAISGVVSILAIWYYYGRNPGLRAMFPFGNPNFLSASLLPGILLCVAGIFEAMHHARRTRRDVPWIAVVGLVLVAACCAWAFALTRSRGAMVGLAFGLLAFAFFALRGRMRWGPLIVGIGCVVAGSLYVQRAAVTASPTGRDATLRFRIYAWSYAWDLFRDRPLTGLGQGGFVLHGDALAVNDVLDDPAVFETRIEHAHNEWLETLCDLGSVGIVLLVALLACTFVASDRALALRNGGLGVDASATARDPDDAAQRWRTIGLLAALAALMVEETFGVGLRVAGVATWFFTIVGLLWALGRGHTRSLTITLVATQGRRIASGLIGVVVALVVLVLVQADWSASRNAFGAQTALEAGRFDDATRLAADATNAMNPQRALTNLHRLAEVGLAVARERQTQGLDRAQRAISADPLDRRLLDLALLDLRATDDACKLGNHALKKLISRCPGFIHQGATEYRLNVVQARTADIYNQLRGRLPAGPLRDAIPPVDAAESARFVENASKALQRELRRQPFDPELAVSFARTAGPPTTVREILDTLARPLRLDSVTQDYVESLSHLSSQPSFESVFATMLDEARAAVRGAPSKDAEGKTVEIWAPEKLRLSAARSFVQGELASARDDLLLATTAYDGLPRPSAIGAASAWAELADATFFLSPAEPAAAQIAAMKAIATAPQSGPGRNLIRALQGRMVDYSLVAGDEAKAAESLQTMNESIAPTAIRAEIETRTRRLAESFVRRAEGGGADWLRPELAERLSGWIRRSLESAPEDADARFLAARWALVRKNGTETAWELGGAVAAGLPLEIATSFLDHADEVLPNDASLQAVRASLPKTPMEEIEPQTVPPQ